MHIYIWVLTQYHFKLPSFFFHQTSTIKALLQVPATLENPPILTSITSYLKYQTIISHSAPLPIQPPKIMPQNPTKTSSINPNLLLFSLLASKPYEHLLTTPTNITPSSSFFYTILVTFIVTMLLYFVNKRTVSVYLLNFTCYNPPESFRMPVSNFAEHVYLDKRLTSESASFLVKIMENSGFSDQTCVSLPQGVVPIMNQLSGAMSECRMVVLSVVADLLTKCDIKGSDIDIVVTHSSMFCPVPSISTMIVNKFKMRRDVISYNLSGMGCSAGVIAVDLAKDVLRVHRNSLALIVTTEVLHMNWYTGADRSMLLANCLFRMGGAAILMSSKHSDKTHAKYELLNVVRTTKAQHDTSYTCVFQDTDNDNNQGVSISKNILNVAGVALKSNIATLAPQVLPVSEQFKYLVSLIRRSVRFLMRTESDSNIYVPNFKTAFEHFCIHTGGKAVIKSMKSNLKLNNEDVEASRMVLYKFGNTSSSSIWYELSYIEAKGRMRKGDRVWQIAFGSGFKCNSAVWKRLRGGLKVDDDSPWLKCIDEYPVDVED